MVQARVIHRATGMTERRVKEALHIHMRKGEVMNVDAGLTLRVSSGKVLLSDRF